MEIWNFKEDLQNEGTKDKTGENFLIVTDPNGFDDLVELFGKSNVESIFIYCPDNVRRKRSIGRGDNMEEFERRVKTDYTDFFGLSACADHLIINFEKPIESVIEQVKTIILS